ncbi:MAG TPA: hypothetical protein VHT03_03225 [Rhizomicrobium sp.]|jgi:hypothetical protein|nr:hypothetical protein [Rhizomicrobium sp.]
MAHSLYVTAAMVLAAIVLYRFHRPILTALARFDARNIARKFEEARDRRDRLAHYRHTVRLAEEQVDDIAEVIVSDERTATPVVRFVFAGETFARREDAEVARSHAVMAKARDFYAELPGALSRRGDATLRRE